MDAKLGDVMVYCYLLLLMVTRYYPGGNMPNHSTSTLNVQFGGARRRRRFQYSEAVHNTDGMI